MPFAVQEARDAAWAFVKRHALVFVFTLLALALRAHDLDPVFYYGDDAEYGMVALFLHEDAGALQYPHLNAIEASPPRPFVSQPPLLLYVFAFAYDVFGATDLTGIWVSILFGAATVPVVYALGVVLRDRILGSIAALFVAVIPLAVNMSRRAMLDAGFTFFVSLAFLLLALWMREVLRHEADGGLARPRRARLYAALAGVGLALAALSKLPGVIAIVAALFALVFVLGLETYAALRREAGAPRRLRALGIDALLATVPIALGGLGYLALVASLDGIPFLMEKLHYQLGRVDPNLGAAVASNSRPKPWHWYFSTEHESIFQIMGSAVVLLAAVGLVLFALDVARKPRANATSLIPVLWIVLFFGFLLYSRRKEWFYLAPLSPAFALAAARVPAGLVPKAAQILAARANPFTRTSGAFAVAGIVLFAGLPLLSNGAESYNEVTDEKDKVFGYGTKEAAAYIAKHSQPGDGQIGTLLGRWSLAYYNGQPTFHFYQQGMLKKLIHLGEIRWFVEDSYLDLPHENALWYKIKGDCRPDVATTFEKSWGHVIVWEFQPGRCDRPNEPIFILPPEGFG